MDWMRLRISADSDPVEAARLVPIGRLMLGDMLEGLKLVGQRTGILRRRLENGASITVSFDGTTPIIEIDAPASNEPTLVADISRLWMPRGFLVRPAWSSLPTGAGLPVVLEGDSTVFDAANLDPGPDASRWTAGGGCGEVLLTRDENAGYPNQTDVPVPLFYTSKGGPYISRAAAKKLASRSWSGSMAAFRMAFSDLVAAYADENGSLNQSIATAISAARSHNGVTAAGSNPLAPYTVPLGKAACTPWPKGLYRPAQVLAYMMDAAQSDNPVNAAFPDTYRTVADQLTKDGYSGTFSPLAEPSDWGWDRTSTWRTGELVSTSSSASDMVAAWLADDSDKKVLLADYGQLPFIDAGNRGSYAAACLMGRDAWLLAGNGVWQCDASRNLPALSYVQPRSMSLAWETFPVAYDTRSQTLVAAQTAPGGSSPAFWNEAGSVANYYYGGNADYVRRVQLWDRFLFMSGRMIAMAPEGAMIWAAGIMAVGDVQRIIALTHHSDDQPSDWTQGLCRYVRVWWVDVPSDGLPLHATQVICGTDASDSLAWKGGQKIDLGVLPTPPTDDYASASDTVNSLKYDSVWRFSPDGTKASCLRDCWSFAKLQQKAIDFVDAGGLGVVFTGLPLGVHLNFEATSTELTATIQYDSWTDTTPRTAASAPGIGSLPAGSTQVFTEYRATPGAVDYTQAGQLIYALHGDITYDMDNGTISAGLGYVGTSSSPNPWSSEIERSVFVSASSLAIPEMDFQSISAQIMDVNDAVFVIDGLHPKLKFDPVVGYVANPNYVAVKQFTESREVHGVKVCRNGSLLNLGWYACPDGFVFSPLDLCGAAYLFQPLLAATSVQASYATFSDDWLLSYQLAPQSASGMRFLESTPAAADCEFGSINADDYNAGRLIEDSDYRPRGGKSFASFDIPDAAAGGWMIEATRL